MDDWQVDPRRLELLVQLSRLGSMRKVAEEFGVPTSTVSQQLAVLGREARTPLIEPDGRRVRLTPAGHRLAGHAVTILAAIEAARLDLDPNAEPAGTLRVAAFATAVRRVLLPVAGLLQATRPAVRVLILEHEPAEALALLAGDDVDLALTYDYELAPFTFDGAMQTIDLGTWRWGLGHRTGEAPVDGSATAVFARFAEHDWIVNSRSDADDRVVRTVAALAGFTPLIAHRADSLELVQDMIAAGLGVGLLPAASGTIPGVRIAPLRDPHVAMRAHAVTRRGREQWPALALVLRLLAEQPNLWGPSS